MRRLARLCNAIRAISPYGSLSLTGLPSEDGSADLWDGKITMGGVILVETKGALEEVIEELTHKLERMSQRMLARLTSVPPPPGEEPPPSSQR